MFSDAHSLSLSSDGRRIFTTYVDDRAKYFLKDAASDTYNRRWRTGKVRAAVMSPDGRYLIIADDKTIQSSTFRRYRFERIARTPAKSLVRALEFSPDGSLLVWPTKTVRSESPATGRKVIPGPADGCVVTPHQNRERLTTARTMFI